MMLLMPVRIKRISNEMKQKFLNILPIRDHIRIEIFMRKMFEYEPQTG